MYSDVYIYVSKISAPFTRFWLSEYVNLFFALIGRSAIPLYMNKNIFIFLLSFITMGNC